MFRKKIEATKIIKKSLLLFLLVDTKGYSFLLRSRSCLSKKNITVDPIRIQLTLHAEKDDSDIEHDNDISFFQDFQNAKVRKLGADIPISSHIQESIKNSENDFLSAMKQVKTDFQRSKEKFGLNQAIENKILEEHHYNIIMNAKKDSNDLRVGIVKYLLSDKGLNLEVQKTDSTTSFLIDFPMKKV